jgi:integrase
LKTQEVDKARGEWVDPRRGDITFGEWAKAWLASRRVRPSTLARDESYLNSLILPYFADKPLNEIGPDGVREWIAALESAGKAPATVRKAYQILSGILSQAVDDGRLPKSPLPRRPGLRPVERTGMTILTLPQVHHLAATIDPRYRAIVFTAAYTGFRFGEAAGLRIDNVDLLRSTISVSGTLTEVRGEVRFGPPKTQRSARTIAISRSLAEEIGAHIGRHADPAGWIFPAPGGGPLRRTNFRRRIWLPAVAAAGLETLRFHDLRHTHASVLIAQGEHPKVISERLGHASIRTTFDVYGHLMPGMDEEVAERLDHAWQAANDAESRTTRAPSGVTSIRAQRQNRP